MTNIFKTPSRLVTLACTTAILAALPLTFDIDGKTGAMSLKSSFALADSDGGSDNDGGSDHDGGSDDDHDSGSDDDHDSGSDDDDNDESDDDDDGSDDDDDELDDNLDGTGTGTGTGTGGSTDTGATGPNVVRIEATQAGIEVSFSDGTQVEIQNGRYERKNALGRTVEERPATQADIDALNALR